MTTWTYEWTGQFPVGGEVDADDEAEALEAAYDSHEADAIRASHDGVIKVTRND